MHYFRLTLFRVRPMCQLYMLLRGNRGFFYLRALVEPQIHWLISDLHCRLNTTVLGKHVHAVLELCEGGNLPIGAP